MIIKEHSINKKDNFICGYYSSRLDICEEIINYFEQSDKKYLGRTDKVYDPTIKDSVDCLLEGDLLEKYIVEILSKALELYNQKYKFLDYYYPWAIREPVQIQKYEPNQAYRAWHTERMSPIGLSAFRNLVFTTYLKDVTGLGGETEFYYQKVKVKPKTGLTIIWPPDWTHTHRGIPAASDTKYIVTGWFNYINRQKEF
jgi:hypothetical protein